MGLMRGALAGLAVVALVPFAGRRRGGAAGRVVATAGVGGTVQPSVSSLGS